MLEVAGGNPKPWIAMLRAAGVKVLHKSATIKHALKAQEAGVDLVEVVGYEASIAGGVPGNEAGAWVSSVCLSLPLCVCFCLLLFVCLCLSALVCLHHVV